MDIKDIHQIFLACGSVSIDTRKIKPSTLFVAIKGERFDGNTFAAEALESGASHVIIDDDQYYIDTRTILVSNSLETLQQLSSYHRSYLKLPIIGLTGSNGKTTTKELMHVVLSQKFNCKATFGNLNNHIGVPLTLLSFDEKTEIGIVEMGANHQKEIEFLCKIAMPDFGYITNFGKAHLEGFGGAEGVIKGKSEMYDYLRSNGKIAIINLDDPIQVQKSEGIAHCSFGYNRSEADLVIDEIAASPFVSVQYSGTSVKSNLIGLYNANNIIASIAVGRYFGIDDKKIKTAIENYIPENNRSQLIQKGNNEIILDAYNANPSSMAAALDNLRQLKKPNKIAILGDMFELGDESLVEHKNIVGIASKDESTRFLFVGPDFFSSKSLSERLEFFESFDRLSEYLSQNHFQNSVILIKGSRGMALERVVDLLQ
ncbi:MAG TPA: UDP-N-acetylmuramoyl-tripeptide--D-alanyl-D-alanine ligase [Flavobacterium sp.]